jgi:hypothetical protein
MHRQFLDERARRRLAKERGESHVAGSSLNKGKLNKEMEDALSTSLVSSSTWSTPGSSSSSLPGAQGGTGNTKKIRIGASIDSSELMPAPPLVPENKATASGAADALSSIATNILSEAIAKKSDEKEDDDAEAEDDEGGEGDEEALVYDYAGGGMGDDYDDEGDDEYY